MRTITKIIIHCSAGSQKFTAADVVRYHTKVLGWRVPGYHYIVEADGKVVNTVAEEKVSNGVKGFNAHIINIAYIGGVDSRGRGIDNRTAAQKAALVKLLTDLKRRYPLAKIMGHRDIASTDANHNGIIDPWERVKECPCFDAIPEYSNL